MTVSGAADRDTPASEAASTFQPRKAISERRISVMAKRIVLGVVYTVVFYVVTCGLVGGIAGGMAGAKDPQNAAAMGAQAGAKAVNTYRPLIILGVVALGAV